MLFVPNNLHTKVFKHFFENHHITLIFIAIVFQQILSF